MTRLHWLGAALVFLGIGLVMLYAGGLSHWLVAGGLTAGVVGGAALLTLHFEGLPVQAHPGRAHPR